MNNIELKDKVWESLKGSVKKAEKFEDLVAVSFSLLSENNEDIFVAVREGVLMVEPHRYDDNNCEIEASADIIAKVFAGEISFDKALSDGSLQVKSGDVAKFKALEVLVPSKKTAVKKSAPAKTAAKTETKTAAKAAPKTEAKTEAKPAAPKAEAKTEAKPAAEVKPVAPKAEVKTEAKPAAKPAANNKGGKKK